MKNKRESTTIVKARGAPRLLLVYHFTIIETFNHQLIRVIKSKKLVEVGSLLLLLGFFFPHI